MQLDKLNTTLALIANLGVLLGLMFVVLELRQNQASLDAGIQLSLSSAYQDISSRLIENREFAAVLYKVFTTPDELDPVDTLQVVSWTQEYLSLLYATYELRQKGIVSDELWRQNARYFAAFLKIPGYRQIYQTHSRQVYPEEFFVAIEASIEQ